jgi:peptide/nickel transport system ATP-binding protein
LANRGTLLTVEKADLNFLSRKGTRVHALRNVSFSLTHGESLAIVGESGSGKTTLLRTLLGLIPLVSGKISLFGKDTDKCSSSEMIEMRRRCGFIPQDPYGCLPPTLKVIDAVTEPFLIVRGRKEKKKAAEKAISLLSELGLIGERITTARIRSGLSGGQRQRVSVARALILDPSLLLADEPTSMQDASTRGEIIGILKKRTSLGMSLIFVTHDLLLAKAAAENTMVLYGGMICEYGKSSMLLNDPVHPYTEALLSALPRLGKKLEVLPVKGGSDINERGCPFQGRCPLSDEQCLTPPPLVEVRGRKVACWKHARNI